MTSSNPRGNADPTPREVCEEYAGHEWAPAGGGLLICLRCEAERWDDDGIVGSVVVVKGDGSTNA